MDPIAPSEALKEMQFDSFSPFNIVVIKELSYETLTTLSIAFCDSFDDQALEALVEVQPHLQTLKIEGCCYGDSGLFHLAKAVTSLTTLSLSLPPDEVSAKGITKVIEAAKNLKKLVLGNSKVDDSSLNALSLLRNLETLDLTSSKEITDRGVSSLAENKSSNITHLNLSRCSITDNSVQALSHLKHLKILDLSSCNVTDDAFSFFSEGKNFPALISLDISDTQVSNATVEELVEETHLKEQLVALDVSGTKVSQHSLLYFSRFSELQKLGIGNLDLGYAPHVSSERLEVLAQCPKLTHLNITRVATVEGVVALAKKIESLQKLYVYEAKTKIGWLVTPSSFQKYKNFLPKVDFIFDSYVSVNSEL